MEKAKKRKQATRKKKPLIRLTLPNNQYKHVPHDGYITAIAEGDIYLPRTNTQPQVHVRGVKVHIDVRDRAVAAGPYVPTAMGTNAPPGVYVVTGFYDPSLTYSRQSRRTIIMLDGHISVHNGTGAATYHVLEQGTKILTTC